MLYSNSSLNRPSFPKMYCLANAKCFLLFLSHIKGFFLGNLPCNPVACNLLQTICEVISIFVACLTSAAIFAEVIFLFLIARCLMYWSVVADVVLMWQRPQTLPTIQDFLNFLTIYCTVPHAKSNFLLIFHTDSPCLWNLMIFSLKQADISEVLDIFTPDNQYAPGLAV